MGAGQSKAKDGLTGPQGIPGVAGKDGKDGSNVKDWGLWTESDKTEFISAIRNNEAFRDAVKNKLSSDVDFRGVIAGLIKDDSSFKTSFVNSLAVDTSFVDKVSKAVNTLSFKTDITGQLVTTILKDEGFIAKAIGPQGIQGPIGLTGPAGGIGPVGPIGPAPSITKDNIITPVSNILKESGLWCANGDCELPSGKRLLLKGLSRFEQNVSLHPVAVFAADANGVSGGRLNLSVGDLTVGVPTRFNGSTFFNGNIGDKPVAKGVHIGLSTQGDPQIQLNGTSPHIDFAPDGGSGTDHGARIIYDKTTHNLDINTRLGSSVRFNGGDVYIKGINVLDKLTKLRDDVTNIGRDLNDIRTNAVRKDKRYNIRADRSGLDNNNRYLTRGDPDGALPSWSTDQKGEWQKFNFEEY